MVLGNEQKHDMKHDNKLQIGSFWLMQEAQEGRGMTEGISDSMSAASRTSESAPSPTGKVGMFDDGLRLPRAQRVGEKAMVADGDWDNVEGFSKVNLHVAHAIGRKEVKKVQGLYT